MKEFSIIDTHTHLCDALFDADREDIGDSPVFFIDHLLLPHLPMPPGEIK